MNIEYSEKDAADLELVEPLWQKLREHQRVRSPHFPQHYANRTWQARKAELLDKAGTGGIRIDLARDSDSGELIAYCVSTVSYDKQGRLESIYVEPDYRKHGIGDNFMRKALAWMNHKQARAKTLIVGAGNEEVLTFYSRYGFYPKHITLEQVDIMNTWRE